jgi:hypothetical protein
MTPLGGSTQEIFGDQIMPLVETEFSSRPIELLSAFGTARGRGSKR